MVNTSTPAANEILDAGPANPDKAPTPHALDIRGLWTGYGKLPALKDITFQVDAGEVLGIIGPNGSGKTTLLKTILGLVRPWQGEVSVLGRPAEEQRRLMGYMPQVEQVDWDFPVTVGDVALMGRYARRSPFRRTTREDREAAGQAMQQTGMYELRDNLIGELSGGQRRRALLARALANLPQLLLMDEPMAGLDATAQHQLLDLLDDLRSGGATIVVSTHDLVLRIGLLQLRGLPEPKTDSLRAAFPGAERRGPQPDLRQPPAHGSSGRPGRHLPAPQSRRWPRRNRKRPGRLDMSGTKNRFPNMDHPSTSSGRTSRENYLRSW